MGRQGNELFAGADYSSDAIGGGKGNIVQIWLDITLYFIYAVLGEIDSKSLIWRLRGRSNHTTSNDIYDKQRPLFSAI